MFTPHPPRVRAPKTSPQRQPSFGILRDGVTAFEKPSLAGDKQAPFKPETGGNDGLR